LTLRLNRAVRRLAAALPPSFLQAGEPVPAVNGTPLSGGVPSAVCGDGAPTALLFLSSGCPKCRAELPDIAQLLPLAQRAGLQMRIVSMEPAWRLRRFLATTGLHQCAVRVRRQDYLALNPVMATPGYMFVDQDGQLEAMGMIGDDNWDSLCQQLAALQADEAAA
jgi:thiol-disulfide isomerase/thioredoxin